ncbi:hypothetical protein [Nannocystis radixulma]|uniref:Uncharacterized protein n=1 Tax=Nannocystis radixulma TaxID=2995305 RepID=A0ABT5BKP3_9BACT|nr:hypothetical protein [Nannocystis radixulma]MDC0674717.1 hypothetical protein [Nannocystis radixulma]
MTRRWFHTMKLPDSPVPDPSVLAEAVADEFAVASIVGGHGEQELRFVTPGTLVVVISATEVQFFDQPDPIEEDEDDAASAEDEEQTPEDAAEEIEGFLAGFLGLSEDEEDDEDEEDEEDEEDDEAGDEEERVARRVVDALLERGLLELTTPRSRAQVEGRLAHLLAYGERGAGQLAEAIAGCSGVAEFYADDGQLAEVLAASQH